MNPQTGSEEHGPKIDWMGLLRAHGRFILIVAVSVAVFVAIVGGAYMKWGQPTLTVASLEFRPTFKGLADLEYPNGLPFSPNDVTAGPIVDMVYDANHLDGICDRETFRTGFFVEQRSDQSVFLDLEYQSRLTEPRITMVERKLLQEEHAAKRRALPLQYRLVFVVPPACPGLMPLLSKVMVEVLETWASESDTKRGVLNHQVEVLTPATLDIKVAGNGGLLLRADLMRTALQRIIQNIEDVKELPGAALIRLGPGKTTFKEVQGKITDLVGSRLDPLVMTSGRFMVKESALWVAETVAAAERKYQGALQKIQSYKDALREYSDTSPVASVRSGPTGSAPNTGGQQIQAPALDDSFINRIVALSDSNVRFRQQLTESLVEAQLEAVVEQERASYYKRLLQLASGSSSETEYESLKQSLDDIEADGKALTKQFGALYDEFSRVALRASASLYEARKPVTIETSQQYARRSLLNWVAIAFAGAAVLTFGFFAVRSRMKPEPR
jgi:hypothetical protein